MVLHIANDFSGSTVYKNLVNELDLLNIEQIVYNPIRTPNRIVKNAIELSTQKSEIIYSLILNNHTDRIFYKLKIKKILKDIEENVDLSKITFIHAHTWYSDGAVAYELSKKYDIPYIIAVRNTDINLFLKYFIFERKYGMEILLKSKKIITISTVYRKRLLQDSRLISLREKLIKDVVVIPNGLDPYWIANQGVKRKRLSNENKIKLLYIGKFDQGKNVYNLIKAVINLNSKQPIYELTLIGGNGREQDKILKLIESRTDVNYIGPVYDLEALRTFYQDSDIFTMPSKAETFGLVYVEALLQGLPILYTKNEGIDGFYETSIGEKVENFSISEIEKKITTIVNNYSSYEFSINQIANNHQWNLIALDYLKLYQQI